MNSKIKPTKAELLKLSEEITNAEIAKLYNLSASTIWSLKKKYNILTKPYSFWSKYNYKPNIFTNENALSYYLLGVYATDGCVKNGSCFALSSADEDWLSKIRDILCPNKSLEKELSRCWRLNLHNKEMRDWLINNKCTPKKSLTLEFPNIPEKYIPDFIRGCIDGDGSISYKKYKRKTTGVLFYCIKWNLTSASKSFVNYFSNLLIKMGIKNSIFIKKVGANKNSIINGREIIQRNDIYVITGQSKACLKFLKFIYYDEKCLKLERKYDKAKQIFKHYE